MRLSNRKTSFREVKKPILIICEDSKSAVLYLRKKIFDLHINPIDVEVDGESNSSPISVVNYAIGRKENQRKKSKKEGIEEYEAIYCVMDVDDHPTIKKATMKAIDNSLIPIISNQCFELWYLLHFIEFSTANLHRDDIVKKLNKYLGKQYEKGNDIIYDILKGRGNEAKAIQNAKKLKKSAEKESKDRNPLRNPSTEVFVLIEKLNNLAI